jgi:hypothetical protein
MRIFSKFFLASKEFLENKICHAMNANLGQINLRKTFFRQNSSKMQSNALLAW